MSNQTYVKTSARRDFNSCTFTGNVGRVDDLRTFTDRNGEAQTVLSFSVACSQDTMNGDKVVENTLWLRFSAWGKRAESMDKWLRNAKRVTVSGSLRQPDAFMNKQNQPAAALQLNLGELVVQEWKDKDAQAQRPQAETEEDYHEPTGAGDEDGDIPF